MLDKLLTKSFFTRLVSSLLLTVITVASLWIGDMILLVVLLFISFVGLLELYRVYQIQKSILAWIGYGMTSIYYLVLYRNGNEYEYLFLLSILCLMAVLAAYVFLFPKFNEIQGMVIFFGFFYVTVLLSYVYQIRRLETGFYLVWLVFVSSWVCDTCAYFSGVMLGKHKMAPVLSPNKTVEGGVGGIIGSCLVGALYGFIFEKELHISLVSPSIGCALICGVGAMISQIGDLAASAIKRNHNVKDYGKLIPGHGGVLDRFDSVIFVAPAIYFLSIFIR